MRCQWSFVYLELVKVIFDQQYDHLLNYILALLSYTRDLSNNVVPVKL